MHFQKPSLFLLILIICPLFLTTKTVTASESDFDSLVGYLRVAAVDEMDDATGKLNGHIEGATPLSQSIPSSKVDFSGTFNGNELSVNNISLRQRIPVIYTDPQFEIVGEQNTLVVLYNWKDALTQPFTLQTVKEKINSVDNFFKENSYGKVWLNADFVDWITLPISVNDVYRSSLTELFTILDSMVDLKKYDRFILFDNASGSVGTGIDCKAGIYTPRAGYIRASLCHMGAFFDPDVIAHELGHNFCFGHSTLTLSLPESLIDIANLRPYGDDDLMGSSYETLSAIWKTQARWIESSQIQDAIVSGEYLIDQIELPSNNIKVLRIPLGKDIDQQDSYYWIEYRKGLGAFSPSKEEKVEIRARLNARVNLSGAGVGWYGFHTLRYWRFAEGGSISGRVTGESDGLGLKDIHIDLYDVNGYGAISWVTDSSGNYRMEGVPIGDYYLRTWNNKGYVDEFYNNVIIDNSWPPARATIVKVNSASNTPNIDFSLLQGNQASASTLEWNGQASQSRPYSAGSLDSKGFQNVDMNAPFHDPLRGIKVELIDKVGDGIQSKAKLRVTLSGISVSPSEVLNLGNVRLSLKAVRSVTLTNSSSTPLAIGALFVSGPDGQSYNLTGDNCSNRTLLTNEGCSASIEFSPVSLGEKFAVLSIPTNNDIRPRASIGLYGNGTEVAETVSVPTIPSAAEGQVPISYSFTTAGSFSNLGHPVEYQFDWGGPGADNSPDYSPWGAATQRHTWSASTLSFANVRARARSTVDTSVVSDWSFGFPVLVIAPKMVSTPNVPSGRTIGIPAINYTYSTGGSTSNCGETIEYQFDWKGDESDLSDWDSATQSKTWAFAGVYNIRARARCAGDTSVVSGWSSPLSVTISNETVSAPNTPSGPTAGTTGKSFTYSTGGSISNLGHSVEYQFDWKGDGTDLSPWGSFTQSKTWSASGIYNVKARARCTTDTSVISNWSNPLFVSVSVPDISVTPKDYDFGNVKVNRSKTASFMVRNTGNANLVINSEMTGTDVSMFKITTNGGGRTVKPGKTLTIRGAFKPTSKGSRSSSLRITSNDPDSPTTDILLSGTGQ